MTVYVISRMSHHVNYTFYEKVEERRSNLPGKIDLGRIPAIKKQILVKGGAGIPSTRSGFGEMQKGLDGVPLWTADGVVTPISDSDYEILKENTVFQKHLKNGMVRVVSHDISGNHKAVLKETQSMTEDPHAPMTERKLQQKIKISVGKMKQDEDFRL